MSSLRDLGNYYADEGLLNLFVDMIIESEYQHKDFTSELSFEEKMDIHQRMVKKSENVRDIMEKVNNVK